MLDSDGADIGRMAAEVVAMGLCGSADEEYEGAEMYINSFDSLAAFLRPCLERLGTDPDSGLVKVGFLRSLAEAAGVRLAAANLPSADSDLTAGHGSKIAAIVLLYVDDIIAAHTRGSDLRQRWAADFSSKFRWTDFGTDLQEFLSLRIRQSPGTVRVDSERYITDLAHEMFPGGVHASYAVPARPELAAMVDEAVRAKQDSAILTREHPPPKWTHT